MKKIISNLFSTETLLMTSFQYYLTIILYILTYVFTFFFHNPWIILVIIFAIIPLLDHFLEPDNRNPNKEEARTLKKNGVWFKIPLYLAIIHDTFSIIWTIYYVQHSDTNFFLKLGLVLNCANFQASGINVAHEVNHKTSIIENIVGTLSLGKSLYMHFLIEHNLGHHKHVSTPGDPATSRYNESLYQFLPRTVIGSFVSAWKLENERCKENYNSSLCIYNRMIYFTAYDIFFPLLLWRVFNFTTMFLFLFIAILSFLQLEVINYIEHYGLVRKEESPGKYENVTIRHSWNAPHQISNYLLFKLQRHSDHHENSLKPYQTLCSYEESPTLPQGYTAIMLLSLQPKLFFEVMNPILESYRDGGKGPGEKLLEETNVKIFNYIHKLLYFFVGMTFLQIVFNRIL